MSRTFYADCRIEIDDLGDAPAFACDDAEVWIERDAMLVSYFDDDGIVVLEGRADGASGWTLAARSRPRRAFLSPIGEDPGDYAGTIEEQGESARWRLRLGDPASARDAGTKAGTREEEDV